MIYFDNAATTGVKPASVVAAVDNALKKMSANPGRSGYKTSVDTAEEVFGVRQKVADFFGAAGPQNVIFTLNCTHSINCVLKGVLRNGEHVVVSSMEHNAVIRPLKKIGNPFTVADVSLEDDNHTLENFERAIKPNTRLVFCTGASNVTGKALPIEQIGKLCRERGVLFAVDAAQSAGVVPIDIKKMNIDFLCIAAHKGLYAPMGIGILICEKYVFNTLIEGGTGTNSLEMYQPLELPERLESGTINVPGIAGVGAGIDFIRKVGTDKIYKHEMRLAKMLYDGLSKNPQVILYTPKPKENSFVPVIPFNFKGISSEEAASLLAKNGVAVRGGYHCAPSAHRCIGTLETGTVRISPSAFNTELETERFINLLKSEKIYKNLKKVVE